MEITLEQVERLREKADVSYGQAKAALEYSGGNLLDALIYLEEQGVIPRPEDAYYSTKNEAPPPPPQELPVLQVKPEAKQAKQKKHKRRGVRHLLHWLRRILLDNELEIWRKGQPITAVPMLILLIFVIFLYWIAIPLLILGLFNAIFVGGFFQTAYKFAKPFVKFIIAAFAVVGLGETLFHIPGLAALNAFGFAHMGLQLGILALGILLFSGLTVLSKHRAMRNFERIDL